MTVAMPPPLPPQLVDVAEVRAAPAFEVIRYQRFRVHVSGSDALGGPRLHEIVGEAETLSNAVRALVHAHYLAGYVGVQVRYAMVGDDLFVHVDPGTLSDVQVPELLAPYFDDLPRGEVLTDARFEPRRALAQVHADRARLYAETRLEPVDNGGRVLTIEAGETDDRATRIGITFANPGNRFVGRHFLDTDLRHVTSAGDEFRFLWNIGLSGINDQARADEYYDETLTWSRVTPRGLLGLTVHVVDYKQPTQFATVDGDLEEYQAVWSSPLMATLRSRIILDAKLDYTRKRRSAPVAGLLPQDERYPSAEAGVDFTHSRGWGGLDWDFEVGLDLRKGLRSSTADSGADLDYFVWRPSVRADAQISDRLVAGVAAAAQFTGDAVPEQSQWVLGGANALYAWLPGVAAGDSGALAIAQVEYRLAAGEAWTFTPRVFAEYGLSKYESAPPGADDGRIELADAGVEVTARWRWLTASLAAATPLMDDDLSEEIRRESDAGVLFRISARY